MKKWQEIWQEMGRDERVDALTAMVDHLYTLGNDYLSVFQKDLARHLHFRPQTISRMKPQAMVNRLRQCALGFFNAGDWSRLFVHYYLAHKQKIMCDYLDLCHIEHDENGALAEGQSISEPDNLQQITDELLSRYSEYEVVQYFSVLYRNHRDWGFLEAVMPGKEALEQKVSPKVVVEEPLPEPGESLSNDIAESFTQLDRVIIDQIIACVAEEERALDEDQLVDLVETVHALDNTRKRTYFHLGFMDALVPGRTPGFARPEMNQSRRQWYLSGVLAGFARCDDVDKVVSFIEQRKSDFSAAARSRDDVGQSMMRTLVPFLLDHAKISQAAILLRGQLNRVDMELRWLVLEQASHMLRDGQLPDAKALLRLLDQSLDRMKYLDEDEMQAYTERVRRKLGQTFQQGGELTAAAQCFEQLLSVTGSHSANLYADLGLLEGGFRGLQDLPIQGDAAQRKVMLRALEKGRDYYVQAVELEPDGAINAHYALAVMHYLTYMDVSEKTQHLEKALRHADNALAGIQSSDIASEYEKLGILGQCRFIAAVLKMMSLDTSSVQRAEQDWNAISSSPGRFPLDHLERFLDAAAVFESDIQLRIAKSIWKYWREDALDLIMQRDWVMQSRDLRQELRKAAEQENLSSTERFSIWLQLVAAELREGELELVEQALDSLERLALVNNRLADQMVQWLEDAAHYDPVWKEQDVFRVRHNLLMQQGKTDLAWSELRQLYFSLMDQDPREAAQIRDYFEIRQAPGQYYEDLPAVIQRDDLVDDEAGLEQRLRQGARVRIMFIGGNETQAQYNERLVTAIHKDWPGVEIQFEHTGWTSNWGQEISRLKRDAAKSHAVVLITMMRTMLGRTVRKMFNHPPRPWVPCTATGKKSMEDSLRKAALIGLEMRTRNPADYE